MSVGGVLGGAAAGAAVGLAGGPIGLVLGAAVGALAGGLASKKPAATYAPPPALPVTAGRQEMVSFQTGATDAGARAGPGAGAMVIVGAGASVDTTEAGFGAETVGAAARGTRPPGTIGAEPGIARCDVPPGCTCGMASG